MYTQSRHMFESNGTTEPSSDGRMYWFMGCGTVIWMVLRKCNYHHRFYVTLLDIPIFGI